MSKPNKRVFLSYAKEDSGVAKRLYRDLTKLGVDVWYDAISLLPGTRWRDEIKRAIRSSTHFIALLSSRSVGKRGFVQKEVALALDTLDEFPETDIFIIPVRLEQCIPSHEKMKEIHWVDIFPSYDQGLEKILRALSLKEQGPGVQGVFDREMPWKYDDVAYGGWAVVFPSNIHPSIRDNLSSLIQHRQSQATQSREILFRELIYQKGESAYEFLARYGMGPGTPSPDKVPFYLLLIGDPQDIPFTFQTQLSVQYAVGRIFFEDREDYARYAASVLEAEKSTGRKSRNATFVAVKNDDDRATEMTADNLVRLLVESLSKKCPGWDIKIVYEREASKDALRAVHGGPESPTLLFTAAHGLAFPSGHERQMDFQGAILSADWPGPRTSGRPVADEFFFSARDVSPDSCLSGMIIFHFGCYGGGTPAIDDYSSFFSSLNSGKSQAPHPFLARLPQRLLANPGGGALAVIGHVGRSWTSSFLWGEVGPQPQTIEATILSLMKDHSVGAALQYMSKRYSELGSILSKAYTDRERDSEVSMGRGEFSNLQRATGDARDFIVIGDPAVRFNLG